VEFLNLFLFFILFKGLHQFVLEDVAPDLWTLPQGLLLLEHLGHLVHRTPGPRHFSEVRIFEHEVEEEISSLAFFRIYPYVAIKLVNYLLRYE